MKEITGDLFLQDGDAICITTNGFVKSNGEAVMGRGVAKQAAIRFPNLPLLLGHSIKSNGNQVSVLLTNPIILSFPVKSVSETAKEDGSNIVAHMRDSFKPGEKVPGWACKARLDIIRKSALELEKLATRLNWKRVLIPRPGCGAGELDWAQVKPILEEYFDDRFIIANL